MNRLSAIDAFAPAFARVRSMLFQPFRLGAFLKMGFIGMLGGGLATVNGNLNFRGPLPPRFPRGRLPNDPWEGFSRAIRSIHLADYLHIIVAVIVVIAAISLVFLYLFARFRFILFDSVLSGQPAVARGWRKYASQANRYFGFWLVYRLVNWGVMLLIIGVPLWHAYKNGVFSGDNSLPAFFELIASIALGVLLAALIFAIISTLTKDFIMPIMALDDLTVGEAWSSLWRVIQSEPGAWAAYFGMKFVSALASGIALALAFVITALPALLVLGIPFGLLLATGISLFRSGLVVAGMIICVGAGLIILAGVLCWSMVLTAPLSAFFPTYALYFFGGRYPKLGALLEPQPTPHVFQPQIAGTRPAS